MARPFLTDEAHAAATALRTVGHYTAADILDEIADELVEARSELAAFRQWVPEGFRPVPRSAFDPTEEAGRL